MRASFILLITAIAVVATGSGPRKHDQARTNMIKRAMEQGLAKRDYTCGPKFGGTGLGANDPIGMCDSGDCCPGYFSDKAEDNKPCSKSGLKCCIFMERCAGPDYDASYCMDPKLAVCNDDGKISQGKCGDGLKCCKLVSYKSGSCGGTVP